MKITEIKGIVPGAGKTSVLTELFITANLRNKIILTPSNQARQVNIQKLVKLGMHPNKAEKAVKTLKSFKGNYLNNQRSSKSFDMESMEFTEASSHYIPVKSKKHYRKVWNIFMDEASMVSDTEMQDLISNWKIQNLILDGDSLQFGPIASISRIVDSEESSIEAYEWFDKGEFYKLRPDTQVLLNKSMRARDKDLQEVVDLIKQGDLTAAIFTAQVAHRAIDCENKLTDWHIAYTNQTCRNLNSLYPNPERFIVKRLDKVNGFCKSEIVYKNSLRLTDLERKLDYLSLERTNVPTFEDWQKDFLDPAYAITSHKLQGTTITEGDIFIHLDDLLLYLRDVLDKKLRAKILQTFLYVAVSRAVNINQINIYGFGEYDFEYMACRVKSENRIGELTRTGEVLSDVLNEFEELSELVEPMVDESIIPSAKQFSADDPEVIKYLIDNLEYDEAKASILEGEEDYLKETSKAHSVKHRKHKEHKYTDEYLLTFETKKELIKVTKNQKIINRWKELTGRSK